MKVSIIIPVIREDKVIDCIGAIRENSGVDADQYEIVTDIDHDRIGCPKMVKRLVEKASCDLVMFLGDDTEPKRDFLKNALNAMASLSDGWGLVGLNDLETDGNLCATHWLASKKLLPIIGGEFFSTEYIHTFCDAELTLRCQLLEKYTWARNSVVVHPDQSRGKGSLDKDYERTYSKSVRMADRATFKRRIEIVREENNKWFLSKIPKTLHLYWGRNKKLSFMRYMTAFSFSKLNPEWKIKVHYPKHPNKKEEWQTNHQKASNFTGEDYFDRLADIKSVELVEAEFDGAEYDASEVVRSDIYRLKLLEEDGGFWSDFDILYVRPMNAMSVNKILNSDVETLICCHQGGHRTGLLGGTPGKEGFFYELKKLHNLEVSKNLSGIDDYQNSGADLFNSFFVFSPENKKPVLNNESTAIENIPIDCVYPILGNRVAEIFGENFRIQKGTVGVHWYAGNSNASRYENVMDERVINSHSDLPFFSIMKSIYLPGKIKYSILMPYYRRSVQFRNTLVSYKFHYGSRDDIEIIVVEDFKNSVDVDEHEKLNAIVGEFSGILNINCVVSDIENNYNPAPLFNHAARVAEGKFLVLTSPECFHENDIMGGFDKVLDFNDDIYVVCGCMNVGKYPTKISEFSDFTYSNIEWYQHTEKKPRELHFCSVISKHNFNIIGGFDERFSRGINFDDTDFREVLRESGIVVTPIDDLSILHQSHSKDEIVYEFGHGLGTEPSLANQDLFYRKRRKDFKLGIGIPNTERTMNPYFFDSFVTMDKPEFTFMRPPFQGYVGMDLARDSLVSQALSSGCSHLLMMDTDQMYPQDTVTKLLSHDAAVVGTLVHRRYPPFEPVALRGTLGEYIHVPDEECFSGDLISVDAIGCGCVLYDMEVFLKIKPPWFESYQLESGKGVGEDVGFCSKLRCAGFNIYVDTSIEIDHMTIMGVNRDFYKLYGHVEGVKKVDGRMIRQEG